jgi:Arc/MetJ family transcription regulator
MRLSVTADPELLEEARRLANVKTKREAVERALQEFVSRRCLKDLAGSDLVDMNLEELKRWRRSE